MDKRTRNRIIKATACPYCHVEAGDPCQEPSELDGPLPVRSVPMEDAIHDERVAAWDTMEAT